MCSILTTVQYIPGDNIIFNTCNIHYLTNCTETTTNTNKIITYQRRRELQKRTAYTLINVQLNAIDIADGNDMLPLRKSHLYFTYLIVWQYIFAATVNAINAHYIQCLKYVFMKLTIYCLPVF